MIRLAALPDLDAIVALWREVFPEYASPSHPHREPVANVRRKLEHGDGLFWVAELEGRIVGTIMAGYDGHRGWVYSVQTQHVRRARRHRRSRAQLLMGRSLDCD